MNGIRLKFKRKKQESHFKMIVCILLSNIFLFLVLIPGKNENDPLIHKGMEKLILPIKVFVPLSPGKKEYPVELYDERRHLLVRPAYLHPDFNEISREGEIIHMPVEVPQKSVDILIKPNRNFFLAFPWQKEKRIKKRRKYEIIF